MKEGIEFLPPEKISSIVVWAENFGTARTAKKFQVVARTVQRLRKAEREGKLDERVQSLIAAKRKEAREELARECVGALRRSVCVLEELVEATKPGRGKRPEPGQIREVAGAVKILFDAHIVREALGVDGGEQSGSDRPSSPAEEAPSGEKAPPEGSIN